MITAQDIGALAMIEKLTRIWLPDGTPRRNIDAEFDGEWFKKLYEKFIVDCVTEDSRPHRKGKESREAYFRSTYKYDASSYFQLYADRGDNTRFAYSERFNFWRLYSTEPFPTDDQEPGYKFYGHMGCISFDDEHGLFIARRNTPETSYSSESRIEFADKWLPFFRRNCWLCGCDIECSQQERLEWLQGLTHEEIEAWQLRA